MTKETTIPMHPDPTGVFDSDPKDTAYRVAAALFTRGSTDLSKVARAVGVAESVAREFLARWRDQQRRTK